MIFASRIIERFTTGPTVIGDVHVKRKIEQEISTYISELQLKKSSKKSTKLSHAKIQEQLQKNLDLLDSETDALTKQPTKTGEDPELEQ